MRGSDFVFDCVRLWYYECHKINFKRGESYIVSPDLIKKQQQQQQITLIKKIINVSNTM